MACSVCSRYDARSACLFSVSYYSPVMPMGRLRACKYKVQSHIINNLLNSNVRSLRRILKLSHVVLTSLSFSQ